MVAALTIREIPAWALDIRCRKLEALAVIERDVEAHGIGDEGPGPRDRR